MITGIGSPNDALWSQMERAGWAQQIAVDDLSMAGVARTYAFTEAGARAVTTALAELVSWNAQIMELFNGFDPHTEPERVQQLCSLFSRLALRAAAQLAIAKKSTPATEEAQTRQRDCILALDEISKGVLMAGQYIVEALALGPDSDAGRDRLERTTKGLRYAEQCLREWATEMRVQQSGPPS
jgi:Arc/MetJ family transcription regulator